MPFITLLLYTVEEKTVQAMLSLMAIVIVTLA